MTTTEFFEKYNKLAIAFSGGVDSAYLLYLAKKHNADVTAYYVKSQFQPQFELDDAIRLANELGAKLKIIEHNAFDNEKAIQNTELRCYYCKQGIMGKIKQNANADGYEIIADGTNASDLSDNRPGMVALGELSIISPLKICGITKAEIRKLSRKAGLFTWDKPAYACLATRIKPDEKITLSALAKVEKSEMILSSFGFSNHRVRVSQNIATIIADKSQTEMLFDNKDKIISNLGDMFSEIIFEKTGR